MKRFFFLLMVAAFGALALVAQVVLLRQIMVSFYGNELVIAVVLGGWLTGVFAGSGLAGGIISSRRPSPALLAFSPLLWIAVLGLLLGLSYALPELTGLAPGEIPPLYTVLTWSVGLTLPGAAFAGWLFVLAGSHWTAETERRGLERLGVGGTIFWVESAGSCLGLLAYTYLLVGRAGPVQVLSLFAGLVLLTMALSLPRLVSTRLLLALLVLALGSLTHFSGLGRYLDETGNALRFRLAHPSYQYLAGLDTPYQNLTLGRRGGETVLFGDNLFTAVWPDPYQYQTLTLFFLTEADSWDRVLLAGQGPGGFIHELLGQGVRELTYVALDPAETALTADSLSPEQAAGLRDPRLRIIHDDLRKYLGSPAGGPFDLIIINAPDPDNARLNRLYTREFFQEARKKLAPRGLLVTSISGAENYWSPELLACGRTLHATLSAVFRQVVVTPGDRHFFFAADEQGVVTADTALLAERYRRRGFDSPHLTPRSFPLFFPPDGVEYLNRRLAAPEPVRINTDAEPVSYFLRLVWWEKMAGGNWTGRLLGRILEAGRWGPWAAGLLLLPFLLITVRPSPRRAAVWTMALTGAMTMALQVVLIYLFQNRYGIIYQQIGLVSALFMAGLAVGGLLGRLLAGSLVRPARLLPVVETALAAVAVLTALNAWGLSAESIMPLITATGVFSGLEFALLFAFYLEDNSRPEVSSALAALEAADHGGAVFGVLAAGLVLAPVFGLGWTAAGLAGLKLLGAAALIRPLYR